MLLIILLSLIHLPSWWWGQGWAAATHVVYKENIIQESRWRKNLAKK
jgi:hypothetical protein